MGRLARVERAGTLTARERAVEDLNLLLERDPRAMRRYLENLSMEHWLERFFGPTGDARPVPAEAAPKPRP